MAKKKGTVTETMKALLAERETIHKSYDNALQKAQAEYDQLEKEFIKAEANAKNTHKAYVLDMATNEEYQKAKKQVKISDEQLRDAGYKCDEINQYRKEDLLELLYKLESNLKAYGKEKIASEEALRYKALKAKYDYLKALHEHAEEHKAIWKVSSDIEDLRVELGLKKYNYHSYDSVYSSLFSNSFNGRQGIDITQQELRQVFHDGTFNKKFLDELEKGKKAGLI